MSQIPFPHIQISDRFDYDQFESFVGAGKFGNVYSAVDITTDQRVALKIIEKNKLDSARAIADIVNEVELGRKVRRNPHCVSVRDAFQTDDKIIIVMELLEGCDLQVLVSQLPRGTSLPEEFVRSFAAQILFAVGALHKMQIVHRDLKAENIMFTGPAAPVLGTDGVFDPTLQAVQYLEQAKATLVDFGLAKSLPRSHHHTSNSNHPGNGSGSHSRAAAGGGGGAPPLQQRRQIAPLPLAYNSSGLGSSGSGFSYQTTHQHQQHQHQLPGIMTRMMGAPEGSGASSHSAMTSHHQNSSVSQIGGAASPTATQPSAISSGFPSLGASVSVGGIVSNNSSNNNNNNLVSNMFGLFPNVTESATSVDSAATPSHQLQGRSSLTQSTLGNAGGAPSSLKKDSGGDNNSNKSPSPVASGGLIVDDAVPDKQSSSTTIAMTTMESNNSNHNSGNGSGLFIPRQASVQSLDRHTSTNSPLVMTPCGTFGFSAPELMRHLASMGTNQKQQTSRQEVFKRDMYGIGLCIYYAFAGRTPFTVRTAAALAKQMEAGPAFPPGGVWDRVSTAAKNFITLLLSSQPEARPTAEMAMAHPWVSDLISILKAQHGPSASSFSPSGSVNNNNVSNNVNNSNGDMMISAHQQQSNNNSTAGSGMSHVSSSSCLLTKRKGKSYEDLAALHQMRENDAAQFDAIQECVLDDQHDSVPRSQENESVVRED